MDELHFRVADVEGKSVRVDVRSDGSEVDFFSGNQKLGRFDGGNLVTWLEISSGSLSDRHIRWRSLAGDVILDIDILFVSQVIDRRDLELLKGYITRGTGGSSVARACPSAPQFIPGLLDLRRVAMEVVTGSGRAAPVEFRVQGAAVEVWLGEAMSGVFDREVLRTWLFQPRRPLIAGSATFFLAPTEDHKVNVSIGLPDVLGWQLAPSVLQHLGDVL